MSKLLAINLAFIVFALGVFAGATTKERYVVSNCDNNMSVMVSGSEYVCMKVPADGLAKNNVQLKEAYKF